MDNINNIRKNIEDIDYGIVDLLIKRNNLVKEIAKIKKELKIPIFDIKREKEIFNGLKLIAKKNGLNEKFIEDIYNLILKNSKEEQEYEIFRKSKQC